jgi:hypothetical protein
VTIKRKSEINMSTANFIEKSFDSLVDCINYIKATYRQETISVQAKDVSNEETFTIDAPRYFYRGESKVYSSTYSKIQRVGLSMPARVKEDIKKVVTEVDYQLQDWLNLDPMLSAGYLQHYGLPTELLDISPSLETAIFFSSYVDKNSPVEEGCFCIFDNRVIHDSSIIINLSDHHLALRPRIQKAYTFFHKSHLDIKAKDCIDDLRLHWLHFKSSKSEKKEYFNLLKYLPDNKDDVTAGFVYMVLTNLDFKVSDFAANYLVNTCEVPAVPLVMDANTGKAKTFNEANIDYDEEVARYNLYRILSNQFPDTRDNQGGLNPYI